MRGTVVRLHTYSKLTRNTIHISSTITINTCEPHRCMCAALVHITVLHLLCYVMFTCTHNIPSKRLIFVILIRVIKMNILHTSRRTSSSIANITPVHLHLKYIVNYSTCFGISKLTRLAPTSYVTVLLHTSR